MSPWCVDKRWVTLAWHNTLRLHCHFRLARKCTIAIKPAFCDEEGSDGDEKREVLGVPVLGLHLVLDNYLTILAPIRVLLELARR